MMAVLPSEMAAQAVIQITPNQVSLSPQQPFTTVQIQRQGSPSATTAFTPVYPVNEANEPWLILQPAGATDTTTPCSPCQAPGNFVVRMIPARVPQNNPGFGTISIGGTGIQPNTTFLTANITGTGTGGTHIVSGTLTFTQTDIGPKSVFVSNTSGGLPNYQIAQSAGSAWLTVVSPPVGFVSSSNTITAQVNPAGLQDGTHS